MSGQQIAGALILAVPFVGLFVIGAREIGWRATVGVFAACAALVVLVLIGSNLLTGSLS